MSVADRFALLEPWTIANNTMIFAGEASKDKADNHKRTTDAVFEHEGADLVLHFQAKGEHPREITLIGSKSIGGETEPMNYTITKKSVRRDGQPVEAPEIKQLIPLMGYANLQLTGTDPAYRKLPQEPNS